MGKTVFIWGRRGSYENYVRAVRAAGGHVCSSENLRDAACCGGLLLPGGGDLEPWRYGRKNTSSRGLDPRRDRAELELMAASREAGPFMIKSQDNRHFFMFGHPEYDADTLANEYWRDVNKGLDIKLPVNYFPDDDPTRTPIVTWRSTGQLIFSNWLNFYVYQTTPYDVREIQYGTSGAGI